MGWPPSPPSWQVKEWQQQLLQQFGSETCGPARLRGGVSCPRRFIRDYLFWLRWERTSTLSMLPSYRMVGTGCIHKAVAETGCIRAGSESLCLRDAAERVSETERSWELVASKGFEQASCGVYWDVPSQDLGSSCFWAIGSRSFRP